MIGRRSKEARGDDREGGFVLMWMALVLVLLLSVAAFGVDLVHAYSEGQHLQNAVDAAALAAAVEIPADTSGATARARACNILSSSPYNITCAGQTMDLDTNLGGTNANQFDVDAKFTFDTFFAKIMGFSTLTVHRKANAQYDAPVEMGSAANYEGEVPECPTTGPLPGPPAGLACENVTTNEFLWASVMGPDAGKHNGNAYTTKDCNNAPPLTRPINPDECVGNVNQEYDGGGEYFSIRKPTAANVDIWVYDPGYTRQFPWCSNGLGITPAIPTTDASSWADGTPDHNVIALQYSDLAHCAGDSDLPTATGVPASPTITTYDVRAPDAIFDRNPADNPDAGGTCPGQGAPKVYPGYNDPAAAHTAEMSGVQTGFHRWVKLCTLSGPASPELGNDYELHVNTTAGTGVNNFSIMALPSVGTPSPLLGVYAAEKLPIAAVNFPSVTGVTQSTFYLARVLPSTHSRKLEVNFFDIGDTSIPNGNSSGQLFLSTTPDVTGASFTCTYTPPPSTGSPAQFLPFPESSFTGSGGCSSGSPISYNTVDSAPQTWNARWVGLEIDIPASYSCGSIAVYQNCWILLNVKPTGGSALSDATTWNASLRGSPVRLTG